MKTKRCYRNLEEVPLLAVKESGFGVFSGDKVQYRDLALIYCSYDLLEVIREIFGTCKYYTKGKGAGVSLFCKLKIGLICRIPRHIGWALAIQTTSRY